MTKQIRQLTAQYVAEHDGKEFLIHGKNFADLNCHQELKLQMQKEQKKEEKKKVLLQKSIDGSTLLQQHKPQVKVIFWHVRGPLCPTCVDPNFFVTFKSRKLEFQDSQYA